MQISPTTLEDLQIRFNRIVSGNDDLKLSNKSVEIFRQMLTDPAATSVKTISELANEFGIHRSFLTRLAQKLGFKGFPEFQSVFRRELKGKTNFYTRQVEKYLQRDRVSSEFEKSTLEEVSTAEWSNILFAMENFDGKVFEAVVSSLMDARRISVLGLRGSYPVAYYLGYYLKMIRDDVSIAGMSGHILAEEIGNLYPGDLLLAISAAPYTKSTVEACHIAHELGIDIIAITDSQISPLINYAKHTLFGACKGNYFFTPLISFTMYVEALLTELIKKSGHISITTLKKKERIFAKMDTEIGKK
jgi:DNA-binding MurR/RpiR family transcriptional regulator